MERQYEFWIYRKTGRLCLRSDDRDRGKTPAKVIVMLQKEAECERRTVRNCVLSVLMWRGQREENPQIFAKFQRKILAYRRIL